nr:MAG TPA: hypothetical protein [Caudoviricetes sp.]
MTSRNRLLFNCYKKPYENSCGFYFALIFGQEVVSSLFLPLAGSLPAGRFRLYPQSLKNGRSQFRRGK